MDYTFLPELIPCVGNFIQSLHKDTPHRRDCGISSLVTIPEFPKGWGIEPDVWNKDNILYLEEEEEDEGDDLIPEPKPEDKKATNRKHRNKKPILIITALEKELKKLLRMLSPPFSHNCEKITQDGRTYYICDITDDNHLVFTSLYDMGNANAALACVAAIELWHPKQIYLTGICTGIEGRTEVGDIVISDQIIDYSMMRIEDNNRIALFSVYRSDFVLNKKLQAFQSQRWLSYLKKRFPDKGITPTVVSGAFLSGNSVIASKIEVDALAASGYKYFAIETEASGISTAIHQSEYQSAFVMVKCVCDLADNKKIDAWQEYATIASASYVMDFILSKAQNKRTKACIPS